MAEEGAGTGRTEQPLLAFLARRRAQALRMVPILGWRPALMASASSFGVALARRLSAFVPRIPARSGFLSQLAPRPRRTLDWADVELFWWRRRAPWLALLGRRVPRRAQAATAGVWSAGVAAEQAEAELGQPVEVGGTLNDHEPAPAELVDQHAPELSRAAGEEDAVAPGGLQAVRATIADLWRHASAALLRREPAASNLDGTTISVSDVQSVLAAGGQPTSTAEVELADHLAPQGELEGTRASSEPAGPATARMSSVDEAVAFSSAAARTKDRAAASAEPQTGIPAAWRALSDPRMAAPPSAWVTPASAESEALEQLMAPLDLGRSASSAWWNLPASVIIPGLEELIAPLAAAIAGRTGAGLSSVQPSVASPGHLFWWPSVGGLPASRAARKAAQPATAAAAGSLAPGAIWAPHAGPLADVGPNLEPPAIRVHALAAGRELTPADTAGQSAAPAGFHVHGGESAPPQAPGRLGVLLAEAARSGQTLGGLLASRFAGAGIGTTRAAGFAAEVADRWLQAAERVESPPSPEASVHASPLPAYRQRSAWVRESEGHEEPAPVPNQLLENLANWTVQEAEGHEEPAPGRPGHADPRPGEATRMFPPDTGEELTGLSPGVRLPERPWQADDVELARVIMSLPGPMATAAVAAGVFDAHAPTIGSTPVESTGGPADTDLAPPPASPGVPRQGVLAGPASVSRQASRFSPISVWLPTGRSSAEPPRAMGMTWQAVGGVGAAAGSVTSRPALLFAPIGRASADSDAAQPASATGGEQPLDEIEAQASEPDLDELAEEVFRRLRWRLAAERERTLSRG